MNLQNSLSEQLKSAFKTLFNLQLESVEYQATRKDFEGDITVVTFPMLRLVKMNPEELGKQLGHYLVQNSEQVIGFNVLKGFLNLILSDAYYLDVFKAIQSNPNYGFKNSENTGAVIVEYSSPNTNKPLHLGHIRNNLLGYSVAQILKAAGHKVYKTQIINDRGIHICKSMLAWQRYAAGQTP
ncbi:MAG: arginine--tRNA ligase, partial [Bacteroidota bacterium]|nr:arginine--tRNA ligase [Bacteroidota bacterium]